MKVLITGGGTAGHINPALAIASYIKEKETYISSLSSFSDLACFASLIISAMFEVTFVGSETSSFPLMYGIYRERNGNPNITKRTNAPRKIC